MNAAANFAMRDCSGSIFPLMRASIAQKRESSASKTAVALGMATAQRQRRPQKNAFVEDRQTVVPLEEACTTLS
jgi:hypothetical protein